jgi:TolA-binding protein
VTALRPKFAIALPALVLIALLSATASSAGTPSRAPAPDASSWKQIGDSFESARLLDPAARIPALDAVDQSIMQALRGRMDDDERAAARFLSARILWERGSYDKAADAFRDVPKGAWQADADFAAIEAMEAARQDEAAAKEWLKWEKDHADSPLLPAAHLARAWNALRRMQPAEADPILAALEKSSPWITGQDRYRLARALAWHEQGRDSLALAMIGESPRDPAALQLRAICLASRGRPLQAAAAFQQVAERAGTGPLADAARLAKANTFLAAKDWRSATEEFSRVAARATDPGIRAEAELRSAGAVLLGGSADSALTLLREIVARDERGDVAARAQFLVAEALVSQARYNEAVVEYNRVLAHYFQSKIAASAQYRVARCMDAMGRSAEATGSYQAVVAGYPLEPEAPAAAYLAGVGLLRQNRPRAAAPYFQIVLDRYARPDTRGEVVFARPEHRELVEAALCMLEWSWHSAGDLGQVAGAPHVLLQKMPPSHSQWRANALLIDADASAALGRYGEAQVTLERLGAEFPDQPLGASARQLLAWTYARQGLDSLAIATEEDLLARSGPGTDDAVVSSASLDIAHARFNQKRYREAAAAYESFLRRWPHNPRRAVALYQAGLCYLRLGREGDAVDRWEAQVRDSASAPLSERAWARCGDVYFQAGHYPEAQRSYRGLLEHFSGSPAAGLASLRLAQCEYNAGHDAAALTAFAATIAQYGNTAYAREAKRGIEQSLYRLGRNATGDTVLVRLIEQYPDSPFAADAMLQIARRHYEASRWSEAADGFRQVVSRYPGYGSANQAQFLMADALSRAGDSTAALAAYEQFLSYFPDDPLAPTASLRAGLLHFEAREYMPAAIAFTRAIADSASAEVRGSAIYDRALCRRELGQTDDAHADFALYASDFPNGPLAAQAACALAGLDAAAGHLNDAATGYEKALDLHPNAALACEAAFRLGRCREQLSDSTAAMRAYVEASHCPDLRQPYRLSSLARLAALHEARHEYGRAIADYREIVQNSTDRELIAAASDRVTKLSEAQRRR